MMRRAPAILCVNPWIHDFAAYDFWSKPLGLLFLASVLRACGCAVFYIDCTDRFHPRAPAVDPFSRHGRGPYLKTPIARPAGMEDVRRTFSRYGIAPEWFAEDLRNLPSRPDLVLVTSIMTYWYPGVAETIQSIKKVFPDVPVVLGGVYATLYPDHARTHSGADAVAPGACEKDLPDIVAAHTGLALGPAVDLKARDALPFPALDLQRVINYAPLVTSRGCPFSCPYCAARFLHPGPMERRKPEAVADEIGFWHTRHGVKDFAFYDDALLIDPERHFMPMARQVIASGWKVRFHTPNALHVREINSATAGLMKKMGFETVRLGLETTSFDNRRDFDAKVTQQEFERAAACLKQAGFDRRQIGAYLLAGLPGQCLSDIEASISVVAKSGITPIPTYYTPMPHTALWPAAVASSRYDLESDPVFTNNALLPCTKAPFSWNTITAIKQRVIQAEKEVA
ncbi:MAG: B12-binding domain-containing radical SAM protein [Thermodesulfobacteriota bacterium]